MKNIIIGSVLLLTIISTGNTEPIRWNPVSSGTPTLAPMPMHEQGASRGYQGSSGANYQYDLNNPADRNRYGIDLDAQRRDMQKINPGSLDDLRGQNGGGYNGR